MKMISGFSNIFENDETYKNYRDSFNSNPYDIQFARDSKEAYKCRFASDYISLINKVAPCPRITKIPEFIYDCLKKGKYSTATKTLDCIYKYCNNSAVWTKYCSSSRRFPDRLKGNQNRRFGKYYNVIYRDAKKELNHYKKTFYVDQVNDCRFALLIINMITRTFYFSALPLHIYPSIYNECIKLDEKFKNYYKYDSTIDKYTRIKFQKKAAQYFSEDLVWLLVYNNILRYGLNK